MPLPNVVPDASEGMKVVRPSRLAQTVLFVGGMGGCGKTMLTPIVGSLERVEIQKYNYAIEHVCTLHRLGKLTDDVAATMIQMQVDLDLYNMMMSRETNFRFSDLSSVWKNPRGWRYFRRLLQPGDEVVPERIQKECPILHITLHDLVQHFPTLFLALGETMRVVELVRHPLYMLKQWYKNVEQFYSDQISVREFSIRFQYGGESLPWFAYGYEKDYCQNKSKIDRLIAMLQIHILERDKVYDRLTPPQRKQWMTIPFERYVKEPLPYMEQLEVLLQSRMTKATRREMKKQKVPRKMIAEGISRPIYKKYGWEPPSKDSDEKQELARRREFAAQHASKEAMEVLDHVCFEYEQRYLLGK